MVVQWNHLGSFKNIYRQVCISDCQGAEKGCPGQLPKEGKPISTHSGCHIRGSLSSLIMEMVKLPSLEEVSCAWVTQDSCAECKFGLRGLKGIRQENRADIYVN